ncbi:MAG: GNAT family N-acetyltransferase [Ruminococcus sp.]|nr:GNAT family N-acetyltransferase [Ruminococcus sp.]
MKSVGTQTIETQRLVLRKFEYSDCVGALKNWASDPKIQLSYGEPVYPTEDDVIELLKKYISSYSNLNYFRWAVIEIESGICIGQIAFFLVDCKNNFAEIEYCIGSKYQCKGYATEAAKAVIEYGFEKAEFHKIQICHRSNNLPSKRVIEKCGFTFDGALRDYFFIDGKYYDRLYYSILSNEFIRRNKENANT